MRELGIQSTMYRKRSKKPTTTTDMPQKPNLMRHLADLSEVVTTDITYIQLINQNWVYLNFQVKCNDDNEFLIVV